MEGSLRSMTSETFSTVLAEQRSSLRMLATLLSCRWASSRCRYSYLPLRHLRENQLQRLDLEMSQIQRHTNPLSTLACLVLTPSLLSRHGLFEDIDPFCRFDLDTRHFQHTPRSTTVGFVHPQDDCLDSVPYVFFATFDRFELNGFSVQSRDFESW
jgi:hypothetical protein